MRVLKFGGTSVATADAIRRVLAIVAEDRRAAGDRGGPVVVVSALGGATDRLLEMAAHARSGAGAEAAAIFDALRTRHVELAAALVPDAGARAPLVAALDVEFAALREALAALSGAPGAAVRALDVVAAAGELLSSRIVTAAAVAAGLPASWADPRGLIVTDDTFTAAIPQEAETEAQTRARVQPLVAAGRVVVTGGFVGATRTGETTTLGRGGSDYSAALLGAALDAAEIQIWTDVDGMLSADPRVVPAPQLVPFLSFDEAAELAYFGAKVLHPKTIQPAVARHVPVRIRNTWRPDQAGTLIGAAVDAPVSAVTALACKRGITVVTIASTRMLMAYGFLRRLFEVFERFRTPVDVVSTSEVSVSVTIDDRSQLDDIVAALSGFAEVSVAHGLALVAVVGDRFGAEPSAFTRVVTALDGVPLRLVSQAAARRNVTLVIDEADLPRAMARLHGEFFERPAAGGAAKPGGARTLAAGANA